MKIAFVSNLFNHHQASISDCLYDLTKGNYCFIATMGMTKELSNLGYKRFENTPYIIDSFISDEKRNEAINNINNSDVVIYGSAPSDLIKTIKQNKGVVFNYSERPLKKGNEWHKYFYRLLKWNTISHPSQNTYLLCASAFASSDYLKFGLYKNKAYKWGYFPETKGYEIKTLLKAKDKKKILWVGRFLDWKHADDAIVVAKLLKDNGYAFSMDIGGTGEMEIQLKQVTIDLGVNDCVNFVGSIPSNQVRSYMENAGIYLFTSDRNEGWGAVLNESMNSGCAIVASHEIGSVPYLMKDKENGLVYHSGNVDELYEKVKYLLDNPREQERLGKAAYETIAGEWNAEVAAERLVNLSEHLLAGENYPDLYKTGPCSKAEIIKDDWF